MQQLTRLLVTLADILSTLYHPRGPRIIKPGWILHEANTSKRIPTCALIERACLQAAQETSRRRLPDAHVRSVEQLVQK